MIKSLDLYRKYIIMFFKSRSEYRLGFIAGIFANLYCYFITFISFWVIVSKFKSIDGWDFSDLSVLYGLDLLSYALAGTLGWYSIYRLDQEVRSGEFDKYLTRPMNIIGQLICQRFGDTFIGQIIITLFFLVKAFDDKVEFITPVKLLYLFLVIVSGVLIHLGAMIIVGSLSFWLIRTREIGDVFYYELRTLTRYPLSIFPGLIRGILTFIFPWAFINYYPTLFIMDKATSEYYLFLGLISPLIGILFFMFSVYLFNKGVKKYSSVGG